MLTTAIRKDANRISKHKVLSDLSLHVRKRSAGGSPMALPCAEYHCIKMHKIMHRLHLVIYAYLSSGNPAAKRISFAEKSGIGGLGNLHARNKKNR